MIHEGRFESQITVHGIGLEPFSLEHSAIEKDPFARPGCQEDLASGYFPCGTAKL
jgi:hypothetical protein